MGADRAGHDRAFLFTSSSPGCYVFVWRWSAPQGIPAGHESRWLILDMFYFNDQETLSQGWAQSGSHEREVVNRA